MKQLSKILPIFLIALSCKAQSPILDISENRGTDNITGAYYKDTHNLLNPFEGTYIYTNGNTSLKIVLQKKIKSTVNNNRYYYDYLIGEYQYIENGIEKINTLNKLSINFSNAWNYSIGGSRIITSGNTGCDECLPNEKAWRGGLVDELTHNNADLIIRRITVNGIQAIKILVVWRMKHKKETDPMPPRASFPGGDYILIKQPDR
ncbi:DUF6705 family protein [Flavobacterium microcysteis]|uniref:DUF6705 domain-containing protein n=1 Tax=Flavobacterium microcysteis TaxID=2596891 RepID=A0A501QGC2_9FLAO|nr:DUF6705 family protein [Flavobacterium microcysteis]TPD71147.1 hypothetical protein FJA49_04405 [Flavobacterium microcysteis]